MTGACRPTPNLDAIIAKAVEAKFREFGMIRPRPEAELAAAVRDATAAVRDALLAEGRIQQVPQLGWISFPPPEETCLVVPLDADKDPTDA